ncbi:DUF6049 family protein [Paramicrobacterium sp. CJ85]|uniref:DUF6049 family protein n=1 Tax=Paramicrobacterium sp. CJ85 TaxID=3445355 RepID=UPI003F619D8B
MNLPSTLARAAVITAVCVATLGVSPSAAHAAVSTGHPATGTVTAASPDDEGALLSVELLDTPIEPDGELRASITVTNSSDTPLATGHVVLSSSTTPFASRDELADYLDLASSDNLTPNTLDTIDVPSITPGSTWTSTPVTVTTEDLQLGDDFGAYAFSGTYVAGEQTAQSRDAFVLDTGTAPGTANIAVAVPITLPPDSASMLSADDLEAFTGEDGLLTRQLDGVLGHPVAIAIDPRIIASIRALGTAAPETATEWLERLDAASNDIFPLQYADADPTAQLQSGASSLLAPTSLDFGMDPKNFTPVEPEEPETETPTGSPTPAGAGTETTPTPTPTVDPNGTPTLDALLAFDYTFPSALWPADDTVTADDITALTKDGFGPIVVSSSNTSAGAHTTVPGRISQGESDLLISDSAASDALRSAISARSDTAQSDAMATLAAELALIGAESGASGRSILLTLDRTVPTSADRMSSVLSDLGDLTGVSMKSLSAFKAVDESGVTVADKPQTEERLDAFTRIRSYDDRIEAFSTALDDPSILIGRQDAAKLTTYSVGWLEDLESWNKAVTEFESSTQHVLTSVTIVRSSPILMIADQISIKISVRNTLDLPVNVIMRASPDNPRLKVEQSDQTQIPAKTQQSVSIPVTARLGNGDVNLRLFLYTPEGVSLGDSSTVPVTVRADWERIGTIILIGGVTLLFVFGVIRTVLRRRREHEAADTDTAESPAETDADSGAPSDADTANGENTADETGAADDARTEDADGPTADDHDGDRNGS